jgi:PGF-CTERM protein
VATQSQSQASAYSGAHVSFGTSANAVTDYTVDSHLLLETVKVQSTSSAESGGIIDVGASLSALTSLSGSAVSLATTTQVSATVQTESSATLNVHDNEHGILVIESGDESQYVQANLSGGAEASATSDSRVVVTTSEGTKGTFILVGDGKVTVNEEGDVVAKLEQGDKLVFRAYPDGRSEADKRQERLIASGEAAAEVYVMKQGEKTVSDVVAYANDTSVNVTQTGEGTVELTAERSTHAGTIILTSVSEKVVSSAEGLTVTVDGKAAVKASSYAELKSAANGGDNCAYMVTEGSAEASADVLVAVNHFSARQITMQAGGAGDGTPTASPTDSGQSTTATGDHSTSTTTPGFGAAVGVTALVAAALLATRR